MQHFGVLMILEMLCINLYISHICLDRRASPAAAVSVLAVFTLLVWGVSVAVMGASPEYGDGGFVVLGFIYLLPLNYLYRRGVKTTLSVMFLAWSYTMLVFLFSQYLGQVFPEPAQQPAMLAVQTAVYVVTLRPFLRLLHEKLLWVIAHAEPDRGNMLLRLSASTCALTFCASWVLKAEPLAAKLALICAMAVNTVMMYQALYGLTSAQRHAVQTRRESLTDELTGLNNRRAFFEEAERLVEGGRPFAIAFIDLDRFKSINDTYGHTAGDGYLRQFAQEFTREFASAGGLYRIAGDEFVFLQEEEQRADAMLERILGFSVRPVDPDIPFLGFSCGTAAFPADAGALDELLSAADSRMYRAKTGGQTAKDSIQTAVAEIL